MAVRRWWDDVVGGDDDNDDGDGDHDDDLEITYQGQNMAVTR